MRTAEPVGDTVRFYQVILRNCTVREHIYIYSHAVAYLTRSRGYRGARGVRGVGCLVFADQLAGAASVQTRRSAYKRHARWEVRRTNMIKTRRDCCNPIEHSERVVVHYLDNDFRSKDIFAEDEHKTRPSGRLSIYPKTPSLKSAKDK